MATTPNTARAFRAVASRLAHQAARVRNPERRATLNEAAELAARNARRCERGTYFPPAPVITTRTAAALAAHRTRTKTALARVRNPERKAALRARLRDLSQRIAAVQASA